MRPRDVVGMLKEAFADWREDNAPRLGAALSYYTVFSIAPLLLIAIAVAGMLFGEEAARGRVVEEIQGLVGRTGAEAVEAMIRSARRPGEGVLATLAGLAALFLGASGAFTELKGALNQVWEVEAPKGGGLLAMVRQRIASFAMVLVVGFLLLVSLLISTGLSAVGRFLGTWVTETLHVLQVVNFVVSTAVVTVLFALIYKLLPDTRVAWRDVWAGAVMTALLFTLGKWGIGLYLGSRNVGSAFGAAGSLVILLVWVYYAAQILFFGAELTQVYARRHGSRIGQAATPKAPAPAAAGAVSAGLVPSRNGRPPSLVQGLLVSAALLGVGFLGRRLGQRRAP